MNLEFIVDRLYGQDNAKSFEFLKYLEKLSNTSNEIYPYLKLFVDMLGSERYVVRVRGFRLFCKQAKWDSQNIINENIVKALIILNDEKPTAVRQALVALKEVIIHKKELIVEIEKSILAIDYLKYKDSMHDLIARDIRNLLLVIHEQKS